MTGLDSVGSAATRHAHVTAMLRNLRTRAGLTTDELAKRIGLRESDLQQYEDRTKHSLNSLSPELVRRMIPVLVGLGKPPIMAEEVIDLAGGPFAGLTDAEVTGAGLAQVTFTSGRTAIDDLCHRFKLSRARLAVEVLEAGDDDEAVSRLVHARDEEQEAIIEEIGACACDGVSLDDADVLVGLATRLIDDDAPSIEMAATVLRTVRHALQRLARG